MNYAAQTLPARPSLKLIGLIAAIKPSVLVKGGDWPVEQIVGAKETLARIGQVFTGKLLAECQGFDGHDPADLGVTSQVDHAHGPLAQFFFHHIASPVGGSHISAATKIVVCNDNFVSGQQIAKVYHSSSSIGGIELTKSRTNHERA